MYSYAIVRQDLDIPLNHSDFGLEVGVLRDRFRPHHVRLERALDPRRPDLRELFMARPRSSETSTVSSPRSFTTLASRLVPPEPTVSANVDHEVRGGRRRALRLLDHRRRELDLPDTA